MNTVSWGRRIGADIASLIASLFFVVAVISPSQAEAQTVTLNSTGGTAADDGLRIDVGQTMQLQIRRDGSGQLFEPGTLPTNEAMYNGVYLALDTAVYGPSPDFYAASAPIPTSNTVSGTGTIVDPYVSVTTFTADTATVEMRISYVVPDPHIDVTLTVTPSATNTATLKLYHLLDTYLAASDLGPAYIKPSVADPLVVGVRRTSPDNLIAFRKTANAFDAVYSGLFEDMWTLIDGGGNLDGTEDVNADTDNGIGVQWNLGVITSATSVDYRITFSDQFCTAGAGSKASPDTGCATALPACDPDLLVCVDCLNDGYCDTGEVCNTASSTCVPCVDDRSGTTQDKGCTADEPMCWASSGGLDCAACLDDQVGSAVDLGCTVSTPLCDTTGLAPVCVVDTSNPDGGVTDGGVTDGGVTDGGVTDGGVTDGGNFSGGCCRVGGAKRSDNPSALLMLLGLAFILYRRRRR